MTAALATLVFLTTLWLLTVVGAMVWEQSGSRILAALKGQSMEPAIRTPRIAVRHRNRERSVYRATARLRAAA